MAGINVGRGAKGCSHFGETTSWKFVTIVVPFVNSDEIGDVLDMPRRDQMCELRLRSFAKFQSIDDYIYLCRHLPDSSL